MDDHRASAACIRQFFPRFLGRRLADDADARGPVTTDRINVRVSTNLHTADASSQSV